MSLSLSLHQETPLYVAAKHGIVDILRYLVVKGADVNSTTNRGVRNTAQNTAAVPLH